MQTSLESNSGLTCSQPSLASRIFQGPRNGSGSRRPHSIGSEGTEIREVEQCGPGKIAQYINDFQCEEDHQSEPSEEDGQSEPSGEDGQSEPSEDDGQSELSEDGQSEQPRENDMSKENVLSGTHEQYGSNKQAQANEAEESATLDRNQPPTESSHEIRESVSEIDFASFSRSVPRPYLDQVRQPTAKAIRGSSELAIAAGKDIARPTNQSTCNMDVTRKSKRARRSAFPDCAQSRQDVIEALGTNWLKFYQDHSSSTDVFSILALVSAVACPEVLLNIATMRRNATLLVCTESGESEIGKAYRLHTNALSSILGGYFQKCRSEVLIHNRFKELTEKCRVSIKTNRKLRYRREYQNSRPHTKQLSNGKASQYALDLLVQECLQTQTIESESSSQRKKIQNIKERGRSLLAFKLEYKQEAIYLWPLFPMLVVQCPLYHGRSVDIQE